ncbi:hypothetical protein FS935_16115 [Metabacillus litoralis]|uniref:Uncharacterized protein n=1 Tax=Metabacillus litoralis TaxID=152268 RepID=A0A5C6W260_9BACI|nr:hypothetical protein [Metabacillus litoralis]TXC89879.1 hypothetical protein FS935_16115 [Metabacillus litoralis]
MVHHKKHELNFSWELTAHPDYKIFSNNENANENEYILLDFENTVLLRFSVQEESFEVTGSSWDTKYKVTRSRKIIVLTEPEVYEEDEEEDEE